MINEELKKWILNNLYTYNKKQLAPIRSRKQWFQKRNLLYYYNEITKHTSFLQEDAPFQERVRYIMNNKYKQVVCQCGKLVIDTRRGKRFCSIQCGTSNKETRDKRKKTNIKKYGYTCSLNNKKVQDKSRKIIREKYGVEYTFQSQNVKKKIQQTMYKRHGIINPGQRFLSQDAISKLSDKEWLCNEYINKHKTCNKIAEEINTTGRTVALTLKKFNIKIRHNYNQSSAETEIINYILSKDKNIKILHGNNKIINPYQIDIYIPNYKLAIEYNGIFFHSYYTPENIKEKRYHLNKTLLCQEKNIQLLHICESEWTNKEKNKIWKSMISYYLSLNNTMSANLCSVREIDNKVSRLFYNKNYIQSYKSSKTNLGLFYKDELVSIASFSKCKYNQKYEYELDNYCDKLFISIKNGINKLFQYFIDNYKPDNIMSYVNFKYSNGKLLEKIGMKYIKRTNPDYFYIKNNKLYSKSNFKKSKLYKLLENFDNNLTESQNMFNNNYRRTWDCGNLIYEWRK